MSKLYLAKTPRLHLMTCVIDPAPYAAGAVAMLGFKGIRTKNLQSEISHQLLSN